MRWARIAFGIVVALVGLVLAAVLLLYVSQPTSYAITRSLMLGASPSIVRAHLDDVHAFAAWAPWDASPSAGRITTTFSTQPSGVGAWIDRRDEDGSGARTTITRVTDQDVEMTSETRGAFGGGHSTQTFSLAPAGTGTRVTWTLAADLHGLARLLWPFVHLEARVGPDMEAALNRLDAACR